MASGWLIFGVYFIKQLWRSFGGDQKRLSAKQSLTGDPPHNRSSLVDAWLIKPWWPNLVPVNPRRAILTSDGRPLTVGFCVDRASQHHISVIWPSLHRISTSICRPSTTKSRVTIDHFGSQVDGHLGNRGDVANESWGHWVCSTQGGHFMVRAKF